MVDAGFQFAGLVLQWGPVPPSGGPKREAYLDHHGRESLQEFETGYGAMLAVLGDRAGQMPALDFDLVDEDDHAARVIQVQKRSEWNRFRATIDLTVLDLVKPHIERATNAAVAALNYLEDHELREEAHLAIHRSTFVKRGLFGCPIILRDGTYWTECQFNISHIRMGLSAGLVSDFQCSICTRPAEDCDHQLGTAYPKIAQRIDSECSICEGTQCDVHVPGQAYPAVAYAQAINAELREASLVSRPRYPLARISGMTKDLGEWGDLPDVRTAAQQGILNCDADLGPCKGLRSSPN